MLRQRDLQDVEKLHPLDRLPREMFPQITLIGRSDGVPAHRRVAIKSVNLAGTANAHPREKISKHAVSTECRRAHQEWNEARGKNLRTNFHRPSNAPNTRRRIKRGT